MPLNLIKQYSNLLEIMHLSEDQRRNSLLGIFNRDISQNSSFIYNYKAIRPVTKHDGISAMQTLFHHLTTEEIEVEEEGIILKRRTFEMDRSVRLHWIKHLLNTSTSGNICVFSLKERDHVKRKDVIRTYIYDREQFYIIVLEPQRNNTDYYLLTAYHLNKSYAPKQMEKKIKNKLEIIY